MIGRNAVLVQPRAGDACDRGGHRRRHGAHGGHDRARAERHQACARVFHGVAAGVHVSRDGRRRVCGRHLSSLHPRVLQGAVVPGFGRRDSRAGRRAGPAAHGRAEERAAAHVLDIRDRGPRDCRCAWAGRLLQQGRDSVSHVRGRPRAAVGRRHADLSADGGLHVPARLPRIPRRTGTRRACTRRPRMPRTATCTMRRRRWRSRSSSWLPARLRRVTQGSRMPWAEATASSSSSHRASRSVRRRTPRRQASRSSSV